MKRGLSIGQGNGGYANDCGKAYGTAHLHLDRQHADQTGEHV